MTLRKIKPGQELGVKRCHSIVTDEATPSRLYFSRAAKAVAQKGVSIYEFTA